MSVRERQVALCVMAKAPIPGEAKTRLGQQIGHEAAAHLAEAFLRDTLDLVGRVTGPSATVGTFVVCPGEHHVDRLRSLVGASRTVMVQQRRGLMGGIVDAFDAGFARGADVVAVADADSPSLPTDHVVACIQDAVGRDVVLGPTFDGGYYLIAARRAAWGRLEALLLGATYDGATICAETLERARALGLTTGTGPTWFDVDTLDELHALRLGLAECPAECLIHTRAALARLAGHLASR